MAFLRLAFVDDSISGGGGGALAVGDGTGGKEGLD
eukprot:CAMPEP_0172448342 /NCGR_PEP_ID=MMETSP1065-20121228/7381_1 /TAXON_ID=265537 /ORGANISM="Amphiprora paludosa, Strain CCMP125" /LENGTH=34 /DNA_ID= /DNA_START= /DNA_END= /DNA_ORIENTATION=